MPHSQSVYTCPTVSKYIHAPQSVSIYMPHSKTKLQGMLKKIQFILLHKTIYKWTVFMAYSGLCSWHTVDCVHGIHPTHQLSALCREDCFKKMIALFICFQSRLEVDHLVQIFMNSFYNISSCLRFQVLNLLPCMHHRF